MSGTKLFCPNGVGDKIVLSRDWHCPHVGMGLWLSWCLSRHIMIFFSRLSGTEQADVVLHVICERIIWPSWFLKEKKWEPCPISSGVVLHDMIERIYFDFIIFSQKEIGSKNHTAHVVLPDVVLPWHPPGSLLGYKLYHHAVVEAWKS